MFSPWGIFNFMAWYRATQTQDTCSEDELEWFYAVGMSVNENLLLYDPLLWWRLYKIKFPNIARLACNVLSIPCMFELFYWILRQLIHTFLGLSVAIERIFSSEHDIISIQCSSLKPETIFYLILYYQKLISKIPNWINCCI